MAPQTRSQSRAITSSTAEELQEQAEMLPTTKPLPLPKPHHNHVHTTTPKFLQLPVEIRLQIYTPLVISARPFFIGRCQEETHRPHNGSPRDFFPGNHHVERDDQPHRPIQPPITKVCRQTRKEALAVFYSENNFWLIHNEFRSHTNRLPRRNFDPWIAQTPSSMFEVMQHISLCGYVAWPNRIKIDLDLRHCRVNSVRTYSTYGDELETYEAFVDSICVALTANAHSNRIVALKAVLSVCDGIWDLSKEHISAPPGLSRARKPQTGPDYDW